MKYINSLFGVLLMACFIAIPFDSVAQKRKKRKADTETVEWRYELEMMNVASAGSKQVKVWSYSKFPETAQEQAKKNAIHGVCFRGVGGGGRTAGLDPLVSASAEKEHEAFFKEFFADGGGYLRYVNLSGDNMIGPGDMVKVGKKEYKVGVVISVAYNDLRKRLENEGIVKKLGF